MNTPNFDAAQPTPLPDWPTPLPDWPAPINRTYDNTTPLTINTKRYTSAAKAVITIEAKDFHQKFGDDWNDNKISGRVYLLTFNEYRIYFVTPHCIGSGMEKLDGREKLVKRFTRFLAAKGAYHSITHNFPPELSEIFVNRCFHAAGGFSNDYTQYVKQGCTPTLPINLIYYGVEDRLFEPEDQAFGFPICSYFDFIIDKNTYEVHYKELVHRVKQEGKYMAITCTHYGNRPRNKPDIIKVI